MKHQLFWVLAVCACAACSKAGNTAGEAAEKEPATEGSKADAASEAKTSSPSSCDKLVQELCGGNDCGKAKTWLEEKIGMNPMSGKPMSNSDKAKGCALILETPASLDGYKQAYASADQPE